MHIMLSFSPSDVVTSGMSVAGPPASVLSVDQFDIITAPSGRPTRNVRWQYRSGGSKAANVICSGRPPPMSLGMNEGVNASLVMPPIATGARFLRVAVSAVQSTGLLCRPQSWTQYADREWMLPTMCHSVYCIVITATVKVIVKVIVTVAVTVAVACWWMQTNQDWELNFISFDCDRLKRHETVAELMHGTRSNRTRCNSTRSMQPSYECLRCMASNGLCTVDISYILSFLLERLVSETSYRAIYIYIYIYILSSICDRGRLHTNVTSVGDAIDIAISEDAWIWIAIAWTWVE